MAPIAALVPLGAALAFPFAAMALKRAMEGRINAWGLVLVCNATVAAVFLPFLFAQGAPKAWQDYWQPLFAGAMFFLGQAAAFKSFQGELSIAIPVQGAKVLLVAILAMLALGQSAGMRVWGACGLSVAAIFLLDDPGKGKAGGPGSRRRTFLLAACAALAFAALDVALQKWSPEWGAARFGAWVFLFQGLLSACLLSIPAARVSRIPRPARKWLAAGALGMALITLGLVWVIGTYGKATQANLLYNSRCVWSVLCVWLLGKWFRNREAARSRGTMPRRLAGACMMMAAIALALA
jgi:drug/metabolite transporter (DMT)-like permease